MTMRKLGFTLVTATALMAAGIVSSLAAPVAPNSALAGVSLIEQAQYVYDGRNYCWYGNGWHGPGWYWCGYAWRRGYGWGGVRGWNNWYWHGWGPHPYHPHRRWYGGRWHY